MRAAGTQADSFTTARTPARTRRATGLSLVALIAASVSIGSAAGTTTAAQTEVDPLISLSPARLLDTRNGPNNTTIDGRAQGVGRVSAGGVLALDVAGRGGVSETADAVLLNVTAVAPDGAGYLTVYPCNENRPNASNVNYVAGDVVPNAVLAKLGPDGRVCIYTRATADILADVTGYVPSGSGLGTLTPARLLETRRGPNSTTIDGRAQGGGRAGQRSVVELDVAGRGGVPNDAEAVVLNVTAVDPDGAGYLTVFPCGESRPTASNVNYLTGDVIPNAVVARVGSNGRVCIYTLAGTDILADVTGYVGAGSGLGTLTPARLLDTRRGPNSTTIDGEAQNGGRIPARGVVELPVRGRGGVPSDAEAVLLNVTAVDPDNAGYLTVYPCGETRPNASNVNYLTGDVVPNAVLAKIGDDGKVCIYTLAETDVLADVTGYVGDDACATDVCFDLSGIVAVALLGTRDPDYNESSIAGITSNGQTRPIVTKGDAAVWEAVAAPDGGLYVALADDANDCLIGHVDPETGELNCIESEGQLQMLRNTGGGGNAPSAPLHPALQLDGSGALYYWGISPNNTSVFRRYANGTATNLSVSAQTYPLDWYVLDDGTAIVAGYLENSLTLTFTIAPNGAVRELSDSMPRFIRQIDDDSVLLGYWNSSPFGIVEYDIPSGELVPGTLIGHPGLADDPIVHDIDTICDPPEAIYATFCQQGGTTLRDSAVTDDGRMFGFSDDDALVRYAPTLDVPDLEVIDVDGVAAAGNRLVVAGRDLFGQHIVTTVAANGSEQIAVGPSVGLDAETVTYIPSTGRVLVAGHADEPSGFALAVVNPTTGTSTVNEVNVDPHTIVVLETPQ